jgi:hypothetical protein
LTSATIVDFLSRECKNDLHSKCQGQWQGLGLNIICRCDCNHKKKEQQALAEVEDPYLTPTPSLSQEATQDDD